MVMYGDTQNGKNTHQNAKNMHFYKGFLHGFSRLFSSETSMGLPFSVDITFPRSVAKNKRLITICENLALNM